MIFSTKSSSEIVSNVFEAVAIAIIQIETNKLDKDQNCLIIISEINTIQNTIISAFGFLHLNALKRVNVKSVERELRVWFDVSASGTVTAMNASSERVCERTTKIYI